jgi:hypothetical protein
MLNSVSTSLLSFTIIFISPRVFCCFHFGPLLENRENGALRVRIGRSAKPLSTYHFVSFITARLVCVVSDVAPGPFSPSESIACRGGIATQSVYRVHMAFRLPSLSSFLSFPASIRSLIAPENVDVSIIAGRDTQGYSAPDVTYLYTLRLCNPGPSRARRTSPSAVRPQR